MPSLDRPVRIFLSYSQKDKAFRDDLVRFLGPFVEKHLIKIWHDREIPPGKNWPPEIAKELETCDIFLALISLNFASSNYCSAIELKRARERHDAGEVVILPVYLGVVSPVLWPSL